MFCSNCGKEIDDKAVICIYCGCKTANLDAQNNKPTKSMAVAILLWLFLGTLGLHRFYLGHTTSGIFMLLCLLFFWLYIPLLILVIWWIIDIFMLVSGGLKPTDGSKLV